MIEIASGYKDDINAFLPLNTEMSKIHKHTCTEQLINEKGDTRVFCFHCA